MSDNRCETCRHWDNSTTLTSDPDRSPCRVNPPVLPIGRSEGAWPATDAADWCGSWAQGDVLPPVGEEVAEAFAGADARLAALRGKLLNADNSVVFDYFETFKQAREEHPITVGGVPIPVYQSSDRIAPPPDLQIALVRDALTLLDVVGDMAILPTGDTLIVDTEDGGQFTVRVSVVRDPVAPPACSHCGEPLTSNPCAECNGFNEKGPSL